MNPVCDAKMIKAAGNTLRTEKFLRGESVEKFEKEFAQYVGAKHAIAVNNGTMALVLALMALGIKRDDYVLTTPASFIATANAILFAGAKPIFVDIDSKTNNIDAQKVEEELSKHGTKIKALIPVHLYGYPAQMDRLVEIAKRHNVKIVEDACQAHGAKFQGKGVGSIGDIAAFSFYPSKNLTVCGDGGMVTTNDPMLAEIMGSLRENGRAKDSQYLHQLIGFTARMNSSNAAIGRVQLERLEKWNAKRRKFAKVYNRGLKGIGDLVLPPKETSEITPVYHIYAIRTKRRDELRGYLKSKEIETGIHYPIPIHLQPPYKEMGFAQGMFPNAEAQANEELSIPMHPLLKREEVEYVIACIKEFFGAKA